MKSILTLILSVLIMACSSCNTVQTSTDTEQFSALEGGDLTALIQGCGNQLVSGYTYCRKIEGDATAETLVFVAPTTKCNRNSCAELKVFYPDGSPTYGYAFKKGETAHRVKWSDLTGKHSFDVEDRGFWPFTYRIFWIDTDGRERETITEGEIRLRVLRQGYIPLHEVRDDANFVWKFIHDKTQVKMTSKGRTYVSVRGL